MLRKLINYIFIYVLLTGCDVENPLVNEYQECDSDFEMNVIAPDLELDENGYYKIEWLEGYTQTFTTLNAVTNTEGYNNIYWDSYNGIMYSGEFVSCVNPSSMTNNGIAKTVMAVWEEMIGDTITVYAGFCDWCQIQHIDSLSVVIKNEF